MKPSRRPRARPTTGRQSSQGFEARAADAAQRLALADRRARLRAAAAAGRTADIEALLDQAPRVDAPDGDGNTA